MVFVPARQATQPGGIGSLESILGLLKSLKIWALYYTYLPTLPANNRKTYVMALQYSEQYKLYDAHTHGRPTHTLCHPNVSFNFKKSIQHVDHVLHGIYGIASERLEY
jgi:hypothetical protein